MASDTDLLAAGRLDLFGAGATFHHVGIVVASIQETYPGLESVFDPTQDVTVAFAEAHGAMLEFIEPGGPQSPVSVNLKKGVKLAHLCYTVPDLEAAIEHALARDLYLIAPPVPAVAFKNRRIAWLYHPALGLFELLDAGNRLSPPSSFGQPQAETTKAIAPTSR